MGYVGTAPLSGDYRKLDDISSGFNGAKTGTFNLTVGTVAVTPPKETTLLISVGGILQEPVSAYTVSGSTITFTAAPATDADFFGVMLGDAIAIGTPSDGTISAAKVENTFISGQTEITSGLDAADELLYSDGGTIKKVGLDTLADKLAVTNITASAGVLSSTDTNTTYSGGTNLTLAGTTFNVDDAFLVNNASDVTSGTITMAHLIVGDGGNIGSASDTDALAIAAGGVVNFTQAPTVASAAIKTAGTETIWVPATSMVVSVNAPSAGLASIDSGSVNTTIPVLDFDGGSSDEVATFNIAFPKSWNAGTVTARFFWTNSNANAGNVVWGLQGICIVDSGALNGAMTDAGEVIQQANITTAGDLMVTNSTPAISINGVADDGVTFFNVFRDASDTTNDTYASDARLIGVQVFFTTDAANDA